MSDLLSQLEQQERAAIQQSAADLLEAQRAEVTLCSRLRAQGEALVHLTLRGGLTVRGRVAEVVPAWTFITGVGAQRGPLRSSEVLVVNRAVTTVRELTSRTGPELGAVESRLGVGHALRRVAVARRPTAVNLVDGSRLEGTLTAVGADHIDVRPHPMDEPAPRGAPTVTVPLSALAAVASGPLD